MDILIFVVIILANAYFLLGWVRLVVPIVIATLRERIAALRKYQVHPSGSKTSKDMSMPSKLHQGEVRTIQVTPSSFVLPESFEAPNNTSFMGAMTPIQAEALDEH